MRIQHLQFLTQTMPGSEAVDFWVWHVHDAPLLLGQYWPSQALWRTLAAFPASGRTPLLDDAQAQALQAILLLLGMNEVGAVVVALQQHALTLTQHRQAQWTLGLSSESASVHA